MIRDFGNIDEVEIGMILNLNGKVKKDNYYDIGVVGEITDYNINSYKNDFYSVFIGMRSIIRDLFIGSFGIERGIYCRAYCSAILQSWTRIIKMI